MPALRHGGMMARGGGLKSCDQGAGVSHKLSLIKSDVGDFLDQR